MSVLNSNGNRWTTEKLQKLIALWMDAVELDEIAKQLGVTRFAISKQVTRMRQDGIPLPRRKQGHKAGRKNQLWTQSEVEYLVRRRTDGATAEQIANELDRSFCGVQAMILKLRQDDVPMPKLGQGSRKLWNSDALRSAVVGRGLAEVIEFKKQG